MDEKAKKLVDQNLDSVEKNLVRAQRWQREGKGSGETYMPPEPLFPCIVEAVSAMCNADKTQVFISGDGPSAQFDGARRRRESSSSRR